VNTLNGRVNEYEMNKGNEMNEKRNKTMNGWMALKIIEWRGNLILERRKLIENEQNEYVSEIKG
jgi:hypothetical protein